MRALACIGGGALLFVTLASPIPVDPPAQIIAAPRQMTPEAIVASPQKVLPLTPEQALAVNAAIPLAADPGAAASPLQLALDGLVFRRAIDCLTSAVYYEAASESDAGQRAVAQVVLNRVRHPAWPNTVCGVVFQGHERRTGCQFSFTCDGSLRRVPSAAGWRRARRVAEDALAGQVFRGVGNATHYHANYVVPYWASSLDKSAVIGAHIFYRWRGSWGRPGAFRERHSGFEPAIRAAASDAEPVNTEALPEEQLAVDAEAGTLLATERALATTPVRPPRVARLAVDQNAGTLLVGSSDDDAPQVVPERSRERCRTPTSQSTRLQAVGGPVRPLGGSAASKAGCRNG